MDGPITHTSVEPLNWEGEELVEEARVTGSVVEFSFGPCDDCYIATSYPYRADYAVDDIRKIATWNVPIEIWHKIEHLRPRYIMNIAFRRGTAEQPLTWFMFCYRGSRFAYDSKWEPRKPSRRDSVGRTLDLWKAEEKDQVSSCSFSDRPDLWFLRSTDGRTEWHAKLGPGRTDELEDTFLTELRRTILKQRKNGEDVPVTTLRAVTFGARGSWILYGKTEFFWKDCGIPQKLVEALKKGKKHKWVINKVVLNPYNRKEYVLVYDNGSVHCCFNKEFLGSFETILDEWSKGMRECGRFPQHQVQVHFQDPVDVEELEDPVQAAQPLGSDESDISETRRAWPRTQSTTVPMRSHPVDHRRPTSGQSQASQPSIPSPHVSATNQQAMYVDNTESSRNAPSSIPLEHTTIPTGGTEQAMPPQREQNLAGSRRFEPAAASALGRPGSNPHMTEPANRHEETLPPERVPDQIMQYRSGPWRSPTNDVREAVGSRTSPAEARKREGRRKLFKDFVRGRRGDSDGDQ